MRSSGLAASDITAALDAMAELTSASNHSSVDRATGPAVLGARAVHVVPASGLKRTYSVSSHSSSIDACAVRICSCGHRCSGTYTPRVATCSIEETHHVNDGGRPAEEKVMDALEKD